MTSVSSVISRHHHSAIWKMVSWICGFHLNINVCPFLIFYWPLETTWVSLYKPHVIHDWTYSTYPLQTSHRLGMEKKKKPDYTNPLHSGIVCQSFGFAPLLCMYIWYNCFFNTRHAHNATLVFFPWVNEVQESQSNDYETNWSDLWIVPCIYRGCIRESRVSCSDFFLKARFIFTWE